MPGSPFSFLGSLPSPPGSFPSGSPTMPENSSGGGTALVQQNPGIPVILGPSPVSVPDGACSFGSITPREVLDALCWARARFKCLPHLDDPDCYACSGRNPVDRLIAALRGGGR